MGYSKVAKIFRSVSSKYYLHSNARISWEGHLEKETLYDTMQKLKFGVGVKTFPVATEAVAEENSWNLTETLTEKNYQSTTVSSSAWE